MLMEGLAVMGCSEATGAKHVNLLQHLMGFLKNHLSSEDTAYRRYIGAPGPQRGNRAGTAAAHRAADAAKASPKPLSGARVGAPAGVPESPYESRHCEKPVIVA
jgi:hypothetical protein